MLLVTRIILIGGAIVVVFDVVASVLLQSLDASLLWMFIGEGVIYLGVGFAGGRVAGIVGGARSGASVAALDCAFGWPITWAIGTGQVSRLSLASALFVLAVMVAIGAVAGTAGAVASRIFGRR